MADILEMLDSKIKEHASLDRAFLLMEYGDWDKAEELLENVLSEEPRNSIAYLGKVMIKEKASSVESLAEISDETKSTPDYQIMLRFADDSVKAVLNAIEEKKQEREKEEEARKQETLKEADGLSLSTKEEELKKAVSLYKSLDGWSDSEEKAQKTEKRLQDLETVYVKMIDRFNASATDEDYLEVVKYLQPVGEYKHAKQIAAEAEKRANAYREGQRIYRADVLLRRGDLASLEEAERIYASIEGQEGKLSECRKRIDAYCTLQYSEALRLMAEGNEYSYTRAIQALNGIPDWRDSKSLIKRCEQSIEDLKEKEREEQERRERELAEKEEAKESNKSEEENTPENTDESVEGIEEDEKEEKRTVKDKKKSSKTKVVLLIGLLLIIGGGLVYCFMTPLHRYIYARVMLATGRYEQAVEKFEELGGYWDSEDLIKETEFRWGNELFHNGDYYGAEEKLGLVSDYKDASELLSETFYQHGMSLVGEERYLEAADTFQNIINYKDSSDQYNGCLYSYAMELSETNTIEGLYEATKYIGRVGDYKDADKQKDRIRCKLLEIFCDRYSAGTSMTVPLSDIANEILYSIDDDSLRTMVMKHPDISFYLLSFADYRYADFAVHYLKNSTRMDAEILLETAQIMSIWCGKWNKVGLSEIEITYENGTLRFSIISPREFIRTSWLGSEETRGLSSIKVEIYGDDNSLHYTYILDNYGDTISENFVRRGVREYNSTWFRMTEMDYSVGFDPIDQELWYAEIYQTKR